MQKNDLIKILEDLKDSETKVKYFIDPVKCQGCDLCKKNCPGKAIEGEIKIAHTINLEKCIRCGSCESVCPFKAVGCQAEI